MGVGETSTWPRWKLYRAVLFFFIFNDAQNISERSLRSVARTSARCPREKKKDLLLFSVCHTSNITRKSNFVKLRHAIFHRSKVAIA